MPENQHQSSTIRRNPSDSSMPRAPRRWKEGRWAGGFLMGSMFKRRLGLLDLTKRTAAA
jgi:hypothetical protein